MPEGSLVKKGDVLVSFQANELATTLENLNSNLNERERGFDKFKLEQQEAEKTNELAVREARSNAEKSAAKAKIPREAVKSNEYEKWVIEKDLNAKLADLSERQQQAQMRARKAELQNQAGGIEQLKRRIAGLVEGKRALRVQADRDGILIYKSNFGGEKFAPGSRIWRGLSVGQLADPDKLFVTAKVPEAQSNQIHLGQEAKIHLVGGNQMYTAKVSALGSDLSYEIYCATRGST